ncbi:MAG: sensor histidine kinase [Flavobacteriaceae bacterium]
MCFLLHDHQSLSTPAERYLLVYMVIVLFIVTGLVVVFFVVFLRRKNKLLLEKIEREKAFEAEIAQAQTETQEQTLKNIGWELHDNIGQLLSFANMQLSVLKMQMPANIKEQFTDTTKALQDGLTEVRALSKTLNNDVVLNVGLKKAITNELSRLERMRFRSAKLNIIGVPRPFAQEKHEIIVFRIIQEFLSNTVKYSNAQNIKVVLSYKTNALEITATDDGIGFNADEVEKGSGLINMQSRASLIHASLELTSKQDEGVQLKLIYPMT